MVRHPNLNKTKKSIQRRTSRVLVIRSESMNNLVIVESPAKAKTIEKFLGEGYTVKSSYGHIRDLAKKDMGIDLKGNLDPIYQISDDKQKIVSDLKKAVKKADCVWLASDEDREGEAIAWHLKETLDLNPETTKRIVFNEITKPAILHAIEHPRDIDMNLVDAQQARRVLDRLVGYEISPILWSKIKPALSAGRVQSVAVRLIVEREEEVRKFVSSSSFRIVGHFLPEGSRHAIVAETAKRFASETEAEAFLTQLKGASFHVSKVETKPAHRSPAPPFTTSTLQQEASRKLGFSVARTMQVAQDLYESGLITYMRTDSTNLSSLALGMAKEVVTSLYGADHVKTRQYTTRVKGAQEAHEAIRPTDIRRTTISGEAAQRRLYELIWKRTIASQMSDAQLERTTVEVATPAVKEVFSCTGEQVVFDGFLKVYLESTDDEEDGRQEEMLLPAIQTDTKLKMERIEACQHFTQHPPRYSEASLVKKLEDLGIGRPSTYAPTISTIIKREYVSKEDIEAIQVNVIKLNMDSDGLIKRTEKTEKFGYEKNKLVPTDIGIVVNHFLMEHFTDIMDYNFTAKVERDFDEIAGGNTDWHEVINAFYRPFHENVKTTQANSKRSTGARLLGTDPKTGKNVYAKLGRFGALVQKGETESEEKPTFASLKRGQSIETITLEEALILFNLPRTVGMYEDEPVEVSSGRFGPYAKHKGLFYSLEKSDDPYTVTLERAIELIEKKRQTDQKKKILQELCPYRIGDIEGKPVEVCYGRFGIYLKYNDKSFRLPKDSPDDPREITLAMATDIIATADKKKSRTTRKK